MLNIWRDGDITVCRDSIAWWEWALRNPYCFVGGSKNSLLVWACRCAVRIGLAAAASIDCVHMHRDNTNSLITLYMCRYLFHTNTLFQEQKTLFAVARWTRSQNHVMFDNRPCVQLDQRIHRMRVNGSHPGKKTQQIYGGVKISFQNWRDRKLMRVIPFIAYPTNSCNYPRPPATSHAHPQLTAPTITWVHGDAVGFSHDLSHLYGISGLVMGGSDGNWVRLGIWVSLVVTGVVAIATYTITGPSNESIYQWLQLASDNET